MNHEEPDSSGSLRDELSELGAFVRNSKRETRKENYLGKYRIDAELGRGGQSTAFRAWDSHLQRDVVLKIYHKARTDEARQHVLEEGRVLARIQSPYVAKCHTVEIFAETPCLVLEYVPGTNLGFRSRQSVYDPEEARPVIRQIATGLAAIHETGITHRDLKPSNVVITPDGTAKIIDFGLAGTGSSSASDNSGTALYFPPERANGLSGGDVRGDIFGLGAILFEMLTGKAPFEACDRAVALERSRRGELSCDLPHREDRLSKSCLRCLQTDPTKRYATAQEFLDASHKPKPKRLPVLLAMIAVVAAACFAFVNSRWSTNAASPGDALRKTATHYVDSSVDSGTFLGTEEHPYKTIKDALGAAGPGDTIRVRYDETDPGMVYREHLKTDPQKHKGVHLTDWPTSDQTDMNDYPVLRGRFPLGSDSEAFRRSRAKHRDTTGPLLEINAPGFRVSHFRFLGADDGALEIRSESPSVSLTGVTIEECSFYRTRKEAILVVGAEEIALKSLRMNYCNYQSGPALSLHRSNGVEISNVSVVAAGTRHAASGMNITDVVDLRLTDCMVSGLRNAPAIQASRLEHAMIHKVFVSQCGHGLALAGDLRAVYVTGCLISSCDSDGISVESTGAFVDELHFDFTTVFRCGGYGIRLASTSNHGLLINSNLLLENGEGSAWLPTEMARAEFARNVVDEKPEFALLAKPPARNEWRVLTRPLLQIQHGESQGGSPDVGAIHSYLPADPALIDRGEGWEGFVNMTDYLGVRRGTKPDIGGLELPSAGTGAVAAEKPTVVGVRTLWVWSRSPSDGSGTKDEPFRSIADALAIARPGDTVRIRGYDDTMSPLNYPASDIKLDRIDHRGLTLTSWGDENPTQKPDGTCEPILRSGTFPFAPDAESRRATFQSDDATGSFVQIRADNVSISHIAFWGNAGPCIVAEADEASGKTVSKLRIESCNFYQNYGEAIRLSACTKAVIKNNNIARCAYRTGVAAVDVSNSRNVAIVENNFTNYQRVPTGSGLRVSLSSKVSITNNQFTHLGTHSAVVLSSSSRVTVERNYFYACGSGIVVNTGDGKSARTYVGPTIVNNVAIACQENAIAISASSTGAISDLVISHNTAVRNGETGLLINGAENIDGELTNSVFLDNDSRDVAFPGATKLRTGRNIVRDDFFSIEQKSEERFRDANICLKARTDGSYEPQLRYQYLHATKGLTYEELGVSPHSVMPIESSAARDNALGDTSPLEDILGATRVNDPDIGAVELQQ